MTEKFIDKFNGHLLILNDFEVTPKTTPDNLILHFGKEKLKIRDIQNGWKHYIISNIKKDLFYFWLTFYFENDILSILSFTIDDKLKPATAWDNWNEKKERQKRIFFDNWLTKQLGKKREFSWGTVGAFYDNKAGFSSIVLRYK